MTDKKIKKIAQKIMQLESAMERGEHVALNEAKIDEIYESLEIDEIESVKQYIDRLKNL